MNERLLTDEDIRAVYNPLQCEQPQWIPKIDLAIADASQIKTLRAVGELLRKRWNSTDEIFLSIKDVETFESGQFPQAGEK